MKKHDLVKKIENKINRIIKKIELKARAQYSALLPMLMLPWWRNYCSHWGKDLFYIFWTHWSRNWKGFQKHCMIVVRDSSYRIRPFCNNHHSGCFLHLPSGKNLFQWKTWFGSGWWAIWVQRTPLLVVTLLLPIKLFHLIFKITHSEENSVGRYS